MAKVKQVLKVEAGDIDERRMEVYKTAAQIFYEKGFNATSMNDIADATGLTKGGLYHYIEGKQELLYIIMNLGLDALEQEVVVPANAIADAETRLKSIIRNHARQIAAGYHAVTVISDEVRALNEAQYEKVTVRRRAYYGLLRSTLDELKVEGKLRDINTRVAVFSILGMILWVSRWYQPDDRLTPDEVSEEILKLAFNALLCSPNGDF